MTAGLPGVGLGGLFHLVSALLAPLVELVRTAQGRSSRRRWLAVGRQFVMAVAMIAALDLTFRALLLIDAVRKGSTAIVIPVVPVLMSLALLGLVLGSAKGAQLVASARRSRRRSHARLQVEALEDHGA